MGRGLCLPSRPFPRVVRPASLRLAHDAPPGGHFDSMIPETRWAKTVDDAYIAYQDFGDGPVTLVVVHGWITHLEVLWEYPTAARFMRRLAERMRVLHFDKRGTGMSDRFARAPDLEARMDDIRAVMDAAEVDQAALFAWGDGGPPLAAFFAATHPERTVALCIDPHIQLKRTHDYPFESTEEDFEKWLAEDLEVWGTPAEVTEDPTSNGARSLAGQAPATERPREALRRYPGCGSRPTSATSCLDPRAHARAFDDRSVVGKSRGGGLRRRADRGGASPRSPASIRSKRRILDRFVGAIETFLDSVRQEEEQMDRVLATVLFTDISGSTAKISALGDRIWRDLVERHHATIRALLARYRGEEMDTAGDGFFATFDGPARAIRCALAIKDAMAQLDRSPFWAPHG